MMKFHFSSPLQAAQSKLFNWQLRVPAEITAAFLASPTKQRVVCVLNGQDPHQCALTPIGQGVYVIKVNQGRIKKLDLAEGETVELDLFPDESKYGLPMPEELAAVLAEDAEGDRLLHALPAGKLRTLLYVVGKGNNSDIRLWRTVQILEHLKRRAGKLDYKELHHDLRL